MQDLHSQQCRAAWIFGERKTIYASASFWPARLAERQAMIRYRAGPDRTLSFDEFVSSGQASIDLANAQMEAAGECLRVVQDEFQKLNLPDRKLDQIMQGWLEAAANSLELSREDREQLELEIICLRPQRSEDKVDIREGESGAARSKRKIRSPEGAVLIAKYIKRNALTHADFAQKAKISERTVRRLLSTSEASKMIWENIAGVMDVRPDELIKS